MKKEPTIKKIYNALILSHFDHCSPVWDCFSDYLSEKLQKLQTRTTRVTTKLAFDTNLSTLNWESRAISSTKVTESFIDV